MHISGTKVAAWIFSPNEMGIGSKKNDLILLSSSVMTDSQIIVKKKKKKKNKKFHFFLVRRLENWSFLFTYSERSEVRRSLQTAWDVFRRRRSLFALDRFSELVIDLHPMTHFILLKSKHSELLIMRQSKIFPRKLFGPHLFKLVLRLLPYIPCWIIKFEWITNWSVCNWRKDLFSAILKVEQCKHKNCFEKLYIYCS